MRGHRARASARQLAEQGGRQLDGFIRISPRVSCPAALCCWEQPTLRRRSPLARTVVTRGDSDLGRSRCGAIRSTGRLGKRIRSWVVAAGYGRHRRLIVEELPRGHRSSPPYHNCNSAENDGRPLPAENAAISGTGLPVMSIDRRLRLAAHCLGAVVQPFSAGRSRAAGPHRASPVGGARP